MTIPLANFIGFANLVYGNPLPTVGSTLTLNGDEYQVYDTKDDASTSYQGMILLDQTTNSMIVVNRGTQEPFDAYTDTQMALTAVNNQWPDALSLAQEAANYASSHEISTVYSVGHSLGGTLTQLQAVKFGWVGVTFNAYGAGEVFNQLNFPLSPAANITNYRTMFDVVSDVSTQLGSSPITIETPADRALLDSQNFLSPSGVQNLITTIFGDHGIVNFSDPNSDVSGSDNGGDHIFAEATAFNLPPPSSQLVALTEDYVAGVAGSLKLALLGNKPVGNLSVAQAAAEAWQLLSGNAVSGIQAIVPTDSALLTNALNPSASNNTYRAALVALSPVALQGVDASLLTPFSLWTPGQTSGLTAHYLIARNDMVSAMVMLAGTGQTAGGSLHTNTPNSYVFSDLSQSSSPLYTIIGNGHGNSYDVVFGDDAGDVLSAAAGAVAELFGGSGADTLSGGTASSTLEGGAGVDTYIIDGDGSGVDSILDTDGQGKIEWQSGGVTELLTGGTPEDGASTWTSSDGSITYSMDLAADGSHELEVLSKNKIAYVDDFTNGEFGIQLSEGTSEPSGPSNLTQLNDLGLVGNTTAGGDAQHVYENDVVGSPVDTIYGGDSSVSNFPNEIIGDGNAHEISAGNGNNTVLLGRFDQRATVALPTAINATVQGGTGNQTLIGVGNGSETIAGGAIGSNTSAHTDIDGGGATGLLEGGGQNSIIYGGTGADTLMASSASETSPAGFNPFTIEMAGLSFWGDAYSSQTDDGKSYTLGSLPQIAWSWTTADDFQINLSPYQVDGSYADPFGLLGSALDSGVAGGSSSLPGSLLEGGSGQDWLIGNQGNDTIVGGDPLAPVNGTLDEVLAGGAGADAIHAGGGTEFIYADMNPGAVSGWADLDAGHADTIYGGSGADYIYGSGGNDVIYGGTGDYNIHTGNGNAYVDTGSGNASVYGGTGNDTIVVDGLSDAIQTGSGNAYVQIASGLSTITAGAGDDTIEADGGTAQIIGGSGYVTVIAGTSAGSDTIQAGTGGATVQLVDGLNESALIARDVNGDLVLSDHGFDAQITVAGYFANKAGVSLQFEDGTTWGASQILAATTTPSADGSNDTLVGSDGNDSITAGFGDTWVVGTSGNNTLSGGAGNDTIQGGSGTDLITGGSGTTQIVGGAGRETYLFNAGGGSDTIWENATVAGSDTLRFGAGIDASAVTYGYGTSSNDLLIHLGSANTSTITVANFFSAQADQHRITAFTFADGTTMSYLQVLQQASAIDGTTGNDNLSGTAGVNYFDGKGGNDDEVGYGGNDTFVFNAGYGHLEINEGYVNGQQPVLQLGTGIAASALHVSSDGASLYLTDGISGDQILLNSMQATANVGVALVQLADGTTLTAAQLLQMEMAGTTGNDTLYGTTGADLLDGKGGNDSITGHGGNDTFVFDSGYGHLEINETYTTGQQPVLQLGPGITASNLQVTQDPYGSNVILTDGVSGDQVTLDDALVYSGDGVQSVALADGTTLTATQLAQLARQINGTTGNDTLSGTSVANDFDGKGGNDVEYGDGGNDTFVFNSGYGQLEISENYLNGQQPVLQLGPGITASALHVTTDALGRNLYLTDGVSGDQIMLDSMMQNSSAGVAAVQLPDGTTLTRAQLIQLEAAGGSTGNDMLVGTSGAELFDGKGGNDTVNGQGGNDTFVFDAGYGDLTIDEYYSAGQQPVLQLGVGIAASALHVTTNGINLVLTDGVSGDQITLDGMWNGSNYGVASVAPADGTTLTQAQLFQMEMTGSSGNDTLYGTTGADRIDGKGGSDSVNGNAGNDTFVFDEGYGQLAISNIYANGEQPVLQLGAGITTATLHASTDGMNVILTDGVNGDQITLDNMWSYSDRGVAAVQLADGTTLTAAQLVPLAIAGQATTGNDTIYGSTGADLFDGKGGSDSILGEGGNDTFVFDAGYGQLYINENYSAGQQPVLQLGSGITAVALHVTSPNGYDLVLSDGISGDQVTLGYMLEGIGSLGVQTVQLADGTTLTAAQLVQMETTGTTGNDTLYGTSGADQFDGKGGTDYAVGHGGNDTFVFNTGYGTLDINENYSSSQQPILQLGAGITAATLHVADSGPNNLLLTDGISGDQVILEGMASSSTAGVSEVLFSDGTALTRAQLLQKQVTDAQTITGTSGPDNLTGTADANLIDGKGGNDTVTGNGGSDTFVFDEGYGQLSIYENYTSGQQPVLQLGAGITAATLIVTTDGNETNLTLTDGISGDQIFLSNMLYSNGSAGVQQVQFADGTTLTAAQLIKEVVITGTTGNDTLYGMYGGSKIDGKGGKDLEVGDGGGSDTFVFNSGYGKLEINESYGGSAQPVLQLGTGITAAALHVTTNGTNLVLTDGVSGDQVTLDSMWSSTTHGVATVQLSNGSSLTRAQLIAMEMAGGTTGKDTLYGTAGAETLDGKGGGDLVYGAGGNDTFIFNSKYGHLEINNTFSSGQTPVLKLGTGISSTAIKVTHSGNNLILTDGVSGDQITLDGMWSSSTSGVTSVMLADGTTLTRAQLIQKGGGSASSTTPVARSTSTDQMLASVADPANGAEEPVIGGTTAVATPPSTTASSAAINHVIGAGNIVMPGSGAAAPTASAAGHGLPVSTSPATSHATSAKAPSTGGGHAASLLAVSATSSRDNAPAFSPLPLAATAFIAPGLHVSTPGPVAEPDEGARLTTGAPTDSITRDPNDADAWMAPDNEAGNADAGGTAPRGARGFDRDATVSRPQARRQLLGRTADAANDMIKALTAQGGLRLSGLESATEGRASQIQMQDGTVWSLSTLDKALSASATAGRSARSVTPTAFGSADLAHAQLISAMAAFGPVASASSSLPPTVSDADAITLAVRAH
ncbi:calcium-binding protein [Paraburkholderia aspalathi]|uniref:Ca2+-binding protein, RTX toxin-related n=1 Tax=Paraburkholderia aspalathi TaxID=1324617 RepID=A0A1I7ACI5_9BURK|nr:calcium-binding protein [Paraburkholderia aspalathi]SFT72603.1 Ca2+-binding protein, RTX toxin-related [Paraburkholderia aspalathi]